jgi:hypothetical protein
MFYQNKKQILSKSKKLVTSLLIASVLVLVGVKPFIGAQTADDLQKHKA